MASIIVILLGLVAFFAGCAVAIAMAGILDGGMRPARKWKATSGRYPWGN